MIGFLRRRYHALIYPFSSDFWMLEGREIKSGENFSLAFAGFENSKNYFKQSFFSECRETPGRRVLAAALKKMASKGTSGASILICEVPEAKRRFLSFPDSIRVPAWVDFELDLSAPLETVFKQKKLAEINRKVRVNGLSPRLAKGEADFRDFYHNMYVPYTQQRHDDRAVIYDYNRLKKMYLSGNEELILVCKDGHALGGVVVDFAEKTPRIWYAGVRDGRDDYRKMGVSEAIYPFSITHIKEKGFDRVSIGRAKPFLNDGLHRNKTLFGGHIGSHHKESGFLNFVLLKKEDKGLAAFLAHHPFVIFDKGRYTVFGQ